MKAEGIGAKTSTYFKLRDIADVVGGFEVGFENDTIILTAENETDKKEDKAVLTYRGHSSVKFKTAEGELFKRERAEQFITDSALILEPSETIEW